MELRLRNYLAEQFNKQHPSKDVRRNLRAMAKLLKEANRLKTVLSANADHMAQVAARELLSTVKDLAALHCPRHCKHG